MYKRVSFLALFAIFLLCAAANAQDSYWENNDYDPAIPTPESVLGYAIGEKYTPHYLIEQYVDAVAKASDRVIWYSYGKTWQGRNQLHIVISSPENIARLDEIKASIRKLADTGLEQSAVDDLAAGTPAVAMLNYTVHGNETSGSEAALRVLYQLAAGQDEKTTAILDNVVTVIDPVQNPDGHDRYVNFINGFTVAQKSADPGSLEHSEPWPGGRTNAYFFDLNRDWFLMTQVESRNRVRAMLEWLPQVAPDLHEMGSRSTYYFAPPMKPLNHLIRETTRKWWKLYGGANAGMLDQHGINYYTEESFDYFYAGYGGSLPSYFGSIAMTYEQASTRGWLTERPDGTLITLEMGIKNHFLTSMATLLITAEKKEERLRDFHTFFEEAQEFIAGQEIQEVYLPPADPARLNKLVDRLQILGGVIQKADEEFTVENAYNYFTKEKETVTLPAGTVVVNLNQMSSLALMTALEPQTPLDPEFIKEERERFRRNLSSRFYDITAWSMPLTYGLQAYYGSTPSSVAKSEMPAVTELEKEIHTVDRARAAYLVPPEGNDNIALVFKLFQAGYKLRAARLPFTLDGREYPEGTIVIRVIRNSESLHEDINTFLAETGGTAYAAQTGLTEDGIDLGSNNVRHLEQPKIAILADDPVSSYNFGHLRFLMEQQYGVQYTAVRTADFYRLDLNDYNVLLIPSSWRSSALKQILGSGGVRKLKDWVRGGNVVIAFGGSVDFLRDEDVGLTAAPKYSQRRKEAGEVEDPYMEAPPAQEEEKSDEKGKEGKKEKYEVERLMRVPGAIVRVRLDDRSFLSWGYPDLFIPALVNSSDVYEPISDDQGIAAARYYGKDELLLAGHMWEESLELLPGKAYAWHEYAGGGMVICFAEEPTFRASYDGLDRLVFNAIIYPSVFTR